MLSLIPKRLAALKAIVLLASVLASTAAVTGIAFGCEGGSFESISGSGYPVSIETENITPATFAFERNPGETEGSTGEISCKTSSYSGSLASASPRLATTPTFEKCEGKIGAEEVKGGVATPAGCEFEFEILKKLAANEWGAKLIVKNVAGKKCEQSITNIPACTVTVKIEGAQAEFIAKVKAVAPKEAELELELKKVEFEATGLFCVLPKKGMITFKHSIRIKNLTIK